MEYTELLKKITEYESKHDVDKYIVDDWHVWPILRTAICLKLYLNRKRKNIKPSVKIRLSGLVNFFKDKCINKEYIFGMHKEKQADIVIISISDRYVFFNGFYFDIYADPFYELFSKNGCIVKKWGKGCVLKPEYKYSLNILRNINLLSSFVFIDNRDRKIPEWFNSYVYLVYDCLKYKILWNDVLDIIYEISNKAKAFETKFKKVKPKYILVICWYDPLVMAAVMAAKRCGINVVEVQHGIQGKGHFGYGLWQKSPLNGYEVIPDVFWCWGNKSAHEMCYNNPGLSKHIKVISGGNLWLKYWMKNNNKQYFDNQYEKIILVTLQQDIPKLLLETIAVSSNKWGWLIRFHPARNDAMRQKDIKIITSTMHPGVNYEFANKSLLYQLFNISDIHITESSTCAIEALVFGVKTIIVSNTELGKTGQVYYSDLIRDKNVLVANSSEDIFKHINNAEKNKVKISDINNYFEMNDDIIDNNIKNQFNLCIKS